MKQRPRFHARKSGFRTRLAGNGSLVWFMCFTMSQPVLAANTPGVVGPPGTETFTTDQTAGVKPSLPSILQLNVKDITAGPIKPAAGTHGIALENKSAGNIRIDSAKTGAPFKIEASGANTSGIFAVSVGAAPQPVNDTFLGVPIPTSQNTPGGVVTVDNSADISTTGAQGHGIVARSATNGYPPEVAQRLSEFLTQNRSTAYSFKVASVLNANGSSASTGTAVTASLLDANGNKIAGAAGKVTLNENGTYSFAAGSDFDSLPVGQSVNIQVDYVVRGTHAANGTKDDGASLVIKITKTGTSSFNTELAGSKFDQFGTSSDAFPDLPRYVSNLLGAAGQGGNGNSVTVTNQGTVDTKGTGAHGIFATSQGGNGGNGSDATVTSSSTRGGPGSTGGTVKVEAGGSITTSADDAAGVVALSSGGNGGTGGDSGYFRNAKAGGAGGTGGEVEVTGNGTIQTTGNRASGIIALSQGGNGGGGGDGSTANSADAGGSGGRGGSVVVDGSWNITTTGNQAHGIWAKSLGGIAGGGGDGGWTGTSAGSGGQGTTGGNVSVTSNGVIRTSGTDSYGIYAESIGGFGGGGGSGTSIFYASGGSGASAGSGGNVAVTNGANGSITTTGARGHGIFAQSVGGGGGSGGGAIALVGNAGGGDSGGAGGTAGVDNQGDITVTGANARGIYAQSVGGGGGDGGDAAGAVSFGGSGSRTSDGGAVSVTNTGTVRASSNALFAQSVGGGGGNGGSSLGWFSFGGSGGGGGDGGNVLLSSKGDLTTTEANASAIFVQSLGGGGGNGGNSAAAGVGGSLSIGGGGAEGGDGAIAKVGVNPTTGAIDPVTGTIRTSGDYSRGIQAQSVGGGGGNGGFSASVALNQGAGVAVAIGGSGGKGGDGGEVGVYFGDAGSSISTGGKDAHGILAQSVGGGGGTGGFSVAASGGFGFNGAFGLGGTGGDGGDGGLVNVGSASNRTLGDITTNGSHSYGILAQSVGGGGGDGGFSIAANAGAGGFGGSLSFGGKAGKGGLGKDVNLYSGSNVTTKQEDSHGIFAQSVGGGGGSGGFSIAGGINGGAVNIGFGGDGGEGGAAGNVVLDSTGTVKTSGSHSYGIVAQSIGGGGGDGGFSVTGGISGAPSVGFSMGGKGGKASSGGSVTLTSDSSVSTSGKDSHALFAQSVGGGGGSGGFSVAASISVDPTGNGAGAAVNASIGGEGGDGGDAGNVVLSSTGATLETQLDHSYGILAQSIGGGGGDGGFSIAGSISTGPSVSFSMGGKGGKGGAAGSVTLDSTSDITTHGGGSHGIFAQSVGGGGGSGGFSVAASVSSGSGGVSASIGGAGSEGGDGKSVTVGGTSAIGGTIRTGGDGSYGVLAQSVGGGGGNGGFSIAGGVSSSANIGFSLGGSGGTAGDGGDVVLNSAATVGTRGDDSHALFAQSVGGGGGSGGFSVGAAASTQNGAIGASIGGSAGAGGTAGKVTLHSTGATITTTGNHADGIHAQSVGGGGGDGGFSIAGGIGKANAASFSIGGNGAAGGASGAVEVENSSAITTTGSTSNGLFAQSVGGGGGSGGFSLSGTVSAENNGIGFSLGGKAGSGGAASSVTVTNRGDISTGGTIDEETGKGAGNGSYGILAQSVGGGGGNGGFSGAFTATVGKTEGNGMSVSIGGDGGGGGNGGTVEVDNDGVITTTADDSIGLFAQSVGGGGGNGGFSLAATLSLAQEKAALSVSIGGKGAGGGDGSIVDVYNRKSITTSGDHSQGIFAQSIGGGGGNGGFSVATSFSGGKETKSLGVSVGGGGGIGGDGGRVSVVHGGAVVTTGGDSSAIQAQSIGGGGGNGGFSVTGSLAGTEGKSLAVSVGGSGGAGGKGGLVEVLGDGSSHALETTGNRSHGVFAQSVGGGGGTGGFSAAVALGVGGNEPEKGSTSIGVSVGGDGGTGNTGGAVHVGTTANRLESDIVTRGDDAAGIFAQSVGGGGGIGGFSLTGSINVAAGQQGPNTNLAIAVGGGGGSGNHGGDVEVHHTGSVSTEGDGSYGIQAQSVGGGGGSGGSSRAITLQLGSKPDPTGPGGKPTPEEKEAGSRNKSLSLSIGGDGAGGGDGGKVLVDHLGDIMTTGGDAHGIFAQSIGGGGGNGGDAHQGFDKQSLLKKYDRSKFTKNVKIVVGGSGGSSGNGDTVDITHTGKITTTGAGANAVFAQSIGGGGGTGGTGVEGATGLIGIGGGTGTTGNGGDVNITLNGTIDTYETAANGIFAQSIGGGGGTAGNVDRGLKNYANIGVGLAFGQDAGNGGDGGKVTIHSNADITTRGEASTAIFAQSVGGGGGVAGSLGNEFPLLEVLNFAGSVGGDGSGGAVEVVQNGNIRTAGAASDGIFAQSAGGKDLGGSVKVGVDGDIFTEGAESNAIFVQSRGDAGNGDLQVTITEGTIQGGSNTGAGVRFADGRDNTLENHGTIRTVDGNAGTSIVGGAGNESVDNHGTVKGSVDLGAGANGFVNRTGALLESGASVDLGAGNQFRNSGTISAGGVGTVQATTLTGDYVQTGDATWNFDLTPDFESDLFAVTGSAQLGAYVNKVNLNEIGLATGPGTYTLITAASGLTGDFRFGSFTGGSMPAGFTFTLQNSDTQEQLNIAESTGRFYWRGGADSFWNGAFIDGVSNWTRDQAGTDFIYGTPGAACDVVFSSTNAENQATTLGTDFSVNSLTIADPTDVSIGGDHTLTILAAEGSGITIESGAGEFVIDAKVELDGDQTWTHHGSKLFLVAGETLSGAGHDLTVTGSGVTVIDAVVQTGAGALAKDGSGTLVLQAANTYSGGTTLRDGWLEARNASALGTGNVMLSGGALATFNDPDAAANTALKLGIGGNYLQNEEAGLQLRIIGPSGVNDQLVIHGSATLSGALRPDYSPQDYNPIPPAGNYTDAFHLLHADGGITGQFTAFIDVHYNADNLLRWEPVYGTHDVMLEWNQHPFTELTGLTFNQTSVAGALNQAMGLGGAGATPLPYNDSTGPALNAHPGLRPAINYLNTRPLAELPRDYDLISPDELTSIFDLGQAFNQVQAGNIERRLSDLRGGRGSGFSARDFNVRNVKVSSNALMPAKIADASKDGAKAADIFTPSPSNRWGVFMSGSAEFLDVGTDGIASGFEADTGGVTLGADYRVNDHFAFGVFGQYTNSKADLVYNGSVDSDGNALGIYATLYDDGFYLNALVAGGVNRFKTRRLGLGGYASGSTDGLEWDGMISGGYTRTAGALSYGPVASLLYSRESIDGFAETGSMLPLVIRNRDESSLASRVGFEASYQWTFGEVRVSPQASIAWRHEFLRDTYDLVSNFVAAPGFGFRASGPEVGQDSLDLRAGVDVQWTRDFGTYLFYNCEIGRTNYQLSSGNVGLYWSF